jgi:hypothetical protein
MEKICGVTRERWASLRALLLRYPNLMLYLAGDNHQNTTTPYFRRERRAGFWQITTAGYVDNPQESRFIDLMRNGDGTLSTFNPARPPRSRRPASLRHAGDRDRERRPRLHLALLRGKDQGAGQSGREPKPAAGGVPPPRPGALLVTAEPNRTPNTA